VTAAAGAELQTTSASVGSTIDATVGLPPQPGPRCRQPGDAPARYHAGRLRGRLVP
jgi:hypothetical protein